MSMRRAIGWLPVISMLLLMAIAPQLSAADSFIPGVVVETNADGQQ